MELWIRSQDKKRITKIDDIYLVHDDDNFCDYIGNTKIGHFAKYTKEGRALEVLDEIQNILKPQMVLTKLGEIIGETCDGTVYSKPNEYDIKEMATYVFEMPEE